MASSPGLAPSRVVDDVNGGWMTRKQRGMVFGFFALIWTIGAFLPGIVYSGMWWNSNQQGGIQAACGTELARRVLATCCLFIFHALLVCPMFIVGDRMHSESITNNHTIYRGFWRTRLAQTATVLQAVGNAIETALLIWTAVQFWHNGLPGACTYNPGQTFQYYQYVWAMLIVGFLSVLLSFITLHWQYTSAAIRDNYGLPMYNKQAPAMVNAP